MVNLATSHCLLLVTIVLLLFEFIVNKNIVKSKLTHFYYFFFRYFISNLRIRDLFRINLSIWIYLLNTNFIAKNCRYENYKYIESIAILQKAHKNSLQKHTKSHVLSNPINNPLENPTLTHPKYFLYRQR